MWRVDRINSNQSMIRVFFYKENSKTCLNFYILNETPEANVPICFMW